MMSEDRAKEIVRRARLVAFDTCSNCGHARVEHTGRTLMNGRLEPKEPDWDSACEHRTDFHHTCPCGEWYDY